VTKVLDSFHTCPIPEVARLGRTLRAWKAQVLAYFDTSGVSNGGTEAINLIIEKVRRLAHGFTDFDHYRLRIMLAADGRRSYRARPAPCLNPKTPQSGLSREAMKLRRSR
jgi:transposase